jgi:hypothetical protein
VAVVSLFAMPSFAGRAIAARQKNDGRAFRDAKSHGEAEGPTRNDLSLPGAACRRFNGQVRRSQSKANRLSIPRDDDDVTANIFRVGILSCGKRLMIPALWRWLKVAYRRVAFP